MHAPARRTGSVFAIPSAASVSRTAASRRSLAVTAFEYVVRGPGPPNTSVIGACTLLQPQPGFPQPVPELGDRRVAAIVEVAPRGEELDGLEPVARDLGQMIVLEPPVVIKVRGNPEAHGTARSCLSEPRIVPRGQAPALGSRLWQNLRERHPTLLPEP